MRRWCLIFCSLWLSGVWNGSYLKDGNITWRSLLLNVWKAYQSTHLQFKIPFPVAIYCLRISKIILLVYEFFSILWWCCWNVNRWYSGVLMNGQAYPRLKRGYFNIPLHFICSKRRRAMLNHASKGKDKERKRKYLGRVTVKYLLLS